MPRTVVMLTLAACLSGCATGASVAPGASAVAPPPTAGVAGGFTASDALDRSIRAHLRFLASDALNGRGSGTRDEWIAATYLGAQLGRLGLEPMGDDGWFVQAVRVQRFETTTPPTLVIGERTLTHGGEMLVRAVTTGSASGPLRQYMPGQPVAPGSIVVLPDDVPADASSVVRRASVVLVRETAAARSRWVEASNRPATVAPRLVNVPAGRAVGPTFITLDEASHDLAKAAGDDVSALFAATIRPGAVTTTWNAVGRLAGHDPAGTAEVVVLSAHLDHLGTRDAPADNPAADVIFNGADDDASGVVAVLELAAALAQGPRPRRTVVVVFFGSEEAGGFGSRYFVDRPVVPLTDVVANLQFEMIGRPDPLVPSGMLWLTGYERSTLGASLARNGARLVQDPRPDQGFFERSDNIQFARRGVVAHTVSSFGLHGEYHQASDELRHINVAHMRDAIMSLVVPIRWLVDGSERPTWHEGMRP